MIIKQAYIRPFINISRQLSNQTKEPKNSKVKANNGKKTSNGAQTSKPSPISGALQPQIDDGTYRAKEYFEHNEWSFVDHMIEMSKYRLPQPTNK